jgi:hypothetical protein
LSRDEDDEDLGEDVFDDDFDDEKSDEIVFMSLLFQRMIQNKRTSLDDESRRKDDKNPVRFILVARS